MSPAFWVAAYYFTFFGALGIFLPYFSLWMVAHGLSPTAATRVIALTPLMSLVSPPLVGLWADARRLRGWLLRAGSVATWLAFLGFFWARARWELVATTALFAFCRAPLTPLIDATALDRARRDGISYGRLRLWGSLGFLVAVAGAGVLAEQAGLPVLIVATTVILALVALCALALPAPPPESHREVVGAWLHLLASGEWWIFFAAVMLGQVATAAYDSAFSLHLSRLGFGGRFIGIAWATGVAAEIGFMALSARLLEHLGAARLFALSLLAAVVRWSLLARVTAPLLILCLQPLHGITFGLFWVSAVTLVRERGRAAPTAAQGLFAAALGGGSVVGMNLAGALLEAGGGRTLYSAAALAAAAGTACAAWYARRAPRIL
jgi:PPP family 3-phenylpropionic acid transporter